MTAPVLVYDLEPGPVGACSVAYASPECYAGHIHAVRSLHSPSLETRHAYQ